MNSSLLVPALIVGAVTAGVFVFGESLFSGSESEPAKKITLSNPKAIQSADVKPTVTGSDFSWDEAATDTAQSPIKTSPESKTPSESFVSTKQSEEAPGDLYGSRDDSQTDESFGSAGDFASSELSSSNGSTDMDVDDFKPALDLDTASKQVDDDLGGFFNKAPEAADSDSSTARSSVSKSVQTPSAPKEKAVDRPETEVAVASPSNSGSSVDVFDNFGSDSSDFSPAPSTDLDEDMKSVVMGEAKKTAPKQLDVASSSDNESSVISGALEPMKDTNDQPAVGGSSNQVSTPVRKFKITNPKETTLAVTLSVDGEKVTLKPDQSYVIQDSQSDVEVTFSRGGSFGFEKKTLKKGHYRFTVSREAGWELVN